MCLISETDMKTWNDDKKKRKKNPVKKKKDSKKGIRREETDQPIRQEEVKHRQIATERIISSFADKAYRRRN